MNWFAIKQSYSKWCTSKHQDIRSCLHPLNILHPYFSGGDKHPQFSISWGIRTVCRLMCTHTRQYKKKKRTTKKKKTSNNNYSSPEGGPVMGKHLSKRNYQDNLLLLSQIYHFQQWRMLLQTLAIYHRKQVGPLRSVLTYKYTLKARL